MTREEARAKLQELVQRYAEHRDQYTSATYNEANTRQDFINPFFKALGWDIDNEKGASEAYREVIHEDRLQVKKQNKTPDYGFRLAGGGKERLFFIEAKKPSVNLKDNKEAAYQLRRYGSSGRAPLSILTNFEVFLVYDCSRVPKMTDSARVALLKTIPYTEYEKEFDFIYDTFSQEGITKGRFDKYVQSAASHKGTDALDNRFVQTLENWRKHLATSMAVNNIKLTDEEITYAVQQTLDRLIFLRFCEDRNVEPSNRISEVVKKGDPYKNLLGYFKEADEKYNSGLFDFAKDTLTPKLKVDAKVVRTVVTELYENDYEFSVMPVEILGNAYEQFLGKVIRITPQRGVRVEEKPEVRKAGGVYYTPQYIVDYIVKNTVGKLVAGKTPAEIVKLKIVDPACGSGSFLLGAYEYLLDYHINWYHENGYASKKSKDNPLTPVGTLATHEKKKILLNNIYGVDLDANAAEVTKLSLLLRCLQGETQASIETQLKLQHDRVLPNLDQNIRDGNSLIDTDFYDNEIDLGYARKIKPFSWKQAYPQVFKQGGFDAVIGNPPYLRMQGLQETQPFAIDYYKNTYEAAKVGNFDLYVLFDERGFGIINQNGVLGFIQPHKFFQADFGDGIRNLIAKENALVEVVSFGSEQVFTDATTYTCLLFLNKQKNEHVNIAMVSDLMSFSRSNLVSHRFTFQHPKVNTKWNFLATSEQALFEKLSVAEKTLGDVTRKIFVGLQTSADKVYVLDTIKIKAKTVVLHSSSLGEEVEIEKGLLKPFLMGKDVKRYEPLTPTRYVIFPYLTKVGSAELMTKDYIIKTYPLGWDYLSKNKRELSKREGGKFKQYWWQFGRTQNLVEFEAVKISTPDIANRPNFSIDNSKKLYHTTTVYSFAFKKDINENEKYYLGLLNSTLMWYFLKSTGNILRGGFFRFKTEYLKPFPVHVIDFKSKKETSQHDEIVKHVDLLLQLNGELKTVKLPAQVSQLQQRIAHSEARIDALVYELYGLTEDEIKIVEEHAHVK